MMHACLRPARLVTLPPWTPLVQPHRPIPLHPPFYLSLTERKNNGWEAPRIARPYFPVCAARPSNGEDDDGEDEDGKGSGRSEEDLDDADLDLPELDVLVEQSGSLEVAMNSSPTGDRVNGEGSWPDDGEEDNAESDADDGYPSRPERRLQLAELLRSAGYAEAAADAPDIDISDIITCNSENASEDSLYVCVPSEEGEDGHEWADEAAAIGAVAVIASQPIPDCLVPVVLVDDTLVALGRLANAFYDRPSAAVHTVAFIGSYGKTTSAWLLRSMLEVNAAEPVVAMIGDSEYSISADLLTKEGNIWVSPMMPRDSEDVNADGSADGDFVPVDVTHDRRSSSPFHMTPYQGKYELPIATPDALHLHKVLAGAVDRGASACLVEVCPLLAADGRVAELSAEVLVFTNVVEEVAANDEKGGSDAYVERISAMFDDLQEHQTAIVNLDDPYGPLIARMVADSKAQMVTYSLIDKSADVYPERIRPSIWETDVVIRTPLGRLNIICSLIGRHNVSNLLSAVCAGLALGVPLEDIVQGAEETQFVPGRCEIIDQEQQFPVVVDAARTPEQLVRLIDAVKDAGARRTILVVGCPGHFNKEMRARIGSAAHLTADIVFFTNDSYGRVPPERIIADTVSGLPEDVLGRHPGSYYPWMQDKSRVPQWFEPWLLRYQSEINRYVIEDRRSAIRIAIGLAKPRDVVVIAGRGDKDYLEIWDGLTPLDMREGNRVTGAQEREMVGAIATEAHTSASGSIGTEDDLDEDGEDGYWELEAVDPSTGESWTVLYEDDLIWDEKSGEHVWERADHGEALRLTGTKRTWFSDRIEALAAVEELFRLENRKDLDRSTIPWTRYPEEREQSGLSATVAEELAAAGGQELDQYLRSVTSRENSIETIERITPFDDDFEGSSDEEGLSEDDDGYVEDDSLNVDDDID